MEPDGQEQERRSPPTRTREITWGVIIPATAIFITVATWSHGIFVGLLDRIADIDSVVSANAAHRVEHEANSEFWIGEIRSNTATIRALEQSVAKLRTVPQYRADAFTGADGRELRDRVERIEGQIAGEEE